MVVTLMGGGDDGAGVAALVVVISAGADAKFETAKLNGPPKVPVVILRIATVAGFTVLVKMQLI